MLVSISIDITPKGLLSFIIMHYYYSSTTMTTTTRFFLTEERKREKERNVGHAPPSRLQWWLLFVLSRVSPSFSHSLFPYMHDHFYVCCLSIGSGI